MKAWLERLAPAGDPISLPDDSGALVLGRSPKATLVFDDLRVSPRHCSVFFEGGFWRVRDLGSEHGTKVNGAALSYPRALFRGDVIEFGGARLRYDTETPADDPALIDAIAQNPEADEGWLVYADWLLEKNDALGERMVRTRRGQRVDHLPWLGPLWDPFVSGELEIDWQFGFIRRATVRPVVGHLPIDWKDAVSTLLRLRIGQLTRELVIDVPGLTIGSDGLGSAQQFMANVPNVPASLAALRLGYLVSDRPPASLTASELLALNVPRLKGTEVFVHARSARLVQLASDPGVKFFGVDADGARALTDVTRVRRAGKGQLHFETPPGIPFVADGNPCHFALSDGRWRLVAGRLRGEIRVNQRVDTVYLLLPGDVIDVQGAGKFRFEVAR